VPRILFHTLIIPGITYAHHRLSEELPRGLALLQALPWLVLDLFFPGVFWPEGNTLLGDNGDANDGDNNDEKNAAGEERKDSDRNSSEYDDGPSGDKYSSSSDKNREAMTSLRERARSNRTNRDLAQLGRRHHLRQSVTRSPSKTRGSSLSGTESESGAERRRRSGSSVPSSMSPSASPALSPQGPRPTNDKSANPSGSNDSDSNEKSKSHSEPSGESALPPLSLDNAAPSLSAATPSLSTPPHSPKHQPIPISSDDQDTKHPRHDHPRRSGSESRGSWGSSYWGSYALQARSLLTGSQDVSIRDHLFDLALPPPSRLEHHLDHDPNHEHHGRHNRRRSFSGGGSVGSSGGGGRSQSLARTPLRPLASPSNRSPRSRPRPVPKRPASMVPTRSGSITAEWAAAQAARASLGEKSNGPPASARDDGAKGRPSESSHPAHTLLPPPSSSSSSSSSSSHVQHRLLRRSSADTLRHLNHSPSKHSSNSSHLKKGDKSSSEAKCEDKAHNDGDADNRPAPRVRKMWNLETQSYENMYSSSSSSTGKADGAANESPDRIRENSGLRRLSRSAQKNLSVGVGRKI